MGQRFLDALAHGLGYGLAALITAALGYCELHYWFGYLN